MTTEELLMKYENQWVFLSKEQINYMLDEILPPLPQQEISDEEIQSTAETFWTEPDESDMKRGWKLGAKWYREQLKSKQ
jgi:hypothetical protein